MKILTIIMALCLPMVGNAAICNLNSCAVPVTVDGGNGKKCQNPYEYDCTCAAVAAYGDGNGLYNCPYQVRTTSQNCSTGYALYSTQIQDNYKCCIKWSGCQIQELSNVDAETRIEEQTSSTNNGLADVFDVVISADPEKHFGYVGTTLRSPNTGRSNAYEAKLDACLFYSDVDAIPGNTTYDKWDNCRKANGTCETTAKNEHCRNPGNNDGAYVNAAVCKDRCDCMFSGYGTCENL